MSSGPELFAFYEGVMTPHERREQAADAVLVVATSHVAMTQALAQLRHGYEQLCHGRVLNQPGFAKGLLGPAIEKLERIQRTFARVIEADSP